MTFLKSFRVVSVAVSSNFWFLSRFLVNHFCLKDFEESDSM